jgi:threonine synthase
MVIEGRDGVVPVAHPRTIVRSLAVGDPGDGPYARRAIVESGGFAAAPEDEETVAAVRLLAETEGIFAETGAAVALAALRRLVEQGRIDGGPVVVVLTGQGLKTAEALAGQLAPPAVIEPRLGAFAVLLAGPLRGLV